ncbi:MAG: amidohydrolase family protein [Novosphingobium sp.]|nr:amidohydrolase family protein [Novosphingobium sp.]
MFEANPIVDKVRAQIDHPVIDSDGHFFEFYPVLNEYLEAEGGKVLVRDFWASFSDTQIDGNWYEMTKDERRDVRRNRPVFWAAAAENTLDLATANFPNLLYQRMDEIGLDFSVMYPGVGNIAISLPREDIRRTSCRAFNRYFADTFSEFSDRMCPVALVPAHTPEEAVEDLEYAVKEMGFRVVLFPSYIKRAIPAAVRNDPSMERYAYWLDTYGVDSDYDYDPLWRKCVELKVLPTFHSPSDGTLMRNSISNYCYNHIGHFAAAGDIICKSLFLGGVTARFPELKFLFLEGGVGWARNLLADLMGHWSKRNGEAIQQFDPSRLDHERFTELYKQYAGSLYREELTDPIGERFSPHVETDYDDFAACGVKVKSDFTDRFVDPFFFGCEADDPITSSAFDTLRNPLGAKLQAVMGSDIGHWDVPDMREVLEEAWEPVENGQMTLGDFRDFTFTNPVNLWTHMNPDFFKGTRVEDAVARELAPA